MDVRIRLVAGLVLGLVSAASLSRRAEPLVASGVQIPPPANSTRRALLIGVTEFQDARLKSRSLKGPGNDVDLFQEVLRREPLSLSAANIRTLKGGVRDPTLRPTRANIQREFTRLAQFSKRGDEVVILLSGHGSQQPANTDLTEEEPDGLDEIFLPEDAAGWDGTVGRVKNAIIDDEIRAWVNSIRNTGAFVWLLIDACQSGTMARGVEVERQIPMSELVPQAAIDTVRHASRRGRVAESDGLLGLSDSAGDVAALYAAQMNETTPEKPLPNGNSPVHGLFTYTIADILSQSSTPLTYRELAMRVLEQYRAIPRYTPTPLFEGGGLDREILGQRTWPERPQMLLGERTSAGPWTLRAGTVHGLSVGSIVELFPPAGGAAADTRIGFMKVIATDSTSARVVPTTFDNVDAPASASLVVGSRARVRHYEFGDLRLRVALQVPHARGGQEFAIVATGRGPAVIERALTNLASSSNGLAERVHSSAADWFVRLIDGRVVLAPSEGWRAGPSTQGGSSAAPVQFVLGAANDPRIAPSLSDALRRISRARNLMRLAGASGSGPHLDLRVVRHASATDTAGRPLLSRPGDVGIRAGEFAEFRVRNTGPRPLDVTVLYIDAAFGIQSIFPLRDREVDNQVRPGETRVIGRFQVTDMPLGWESAVAIAVESTAAHQNFSMLAQDSIATRSGDDRPASPLRQLLERAMFGSPTGTRGTDINPATFSMKLVAWRTDGAEP